MNTLFPVDLNEPEWMEFSAAGFTQKLAGLIH